ncbi:MAG: PQQ-dependent sugar dehydrogenase [Proteobacteria bacterium]|nr:PQQ-dependent sugar dehydrogenase [Pseudomonadota bacterium]
MRTLIVLLLAACHARQPAIDAAPSGDGRAVDAATIDAAVLPACPPTAGTTIALTPVIGPCGATGGPAAPQCTNGLVTFLTSPPSDPRQFFLERQGAIRILENGVARAQPFLDLSVDAGGPVEASGPEQGLFGLAFHPAFAQNHQVFVFYVTQGTTTPYASAIVRYTTMANDPDRADPTSATTLLVIPNTVAKHSGGMMRFGADGFLYIGTGDTGDTNVPTDPMQRAGKMLRLDVDHPSGGRAYGIPTDNPYASGATGAPEVYMVGMRNPWRWSFDRANGDLWIGDVGDERVEELDYLPAGQQLGKNLGWPDYEGDDCYFAPCTPGSKVFPVLTRRHTAGWTAIIGGEVYRGTCYPDLQGWYFFADLGSKVIVRAHRELDGSLTVVEPIATLADSPVAISSDATGELFVSDVAGTIWRITVP